MVLQGMYRGAVFLLWPPYAAGPHTLELEASQVTSHASKEESACKMGIFDRLCLTLLYRRDK